MSGYAYAIVPVTLDLWRNHEMLSADCINDLYSYSDQLKSEFDILDFNPYESNMLRFRITDDPAFKLVSEENAVCQASVLLDCEYLYQKCNCIRILKDSIEIERLTAQTLLDIVLAIYDIVREL